jgi:hypothetical protein
MFEKINSLHGIVGFLGIILLISALLMFFSSKYYSFLSKTFFVEPFSGDKKKRMEESIEKDMSSQRYIVAVIFGGLGIIAILWSISVLVSITVPFFMLAAIISLLKFFSTK